MRRGKLRRWLSVASGAPSAAAETLTRESSYLIALNTFPPCRIRLIGPIGLTCPAASLAVLRRVPENPGLILRFARQTGVCPEGFRWVSTSNQADHDQHARPTSKSSPRRSHSSEHAAPCNLQIGTPRGNAETGDPSGPRSPARDGRESPWKVETLPFSLSRGTLTRLSFRVAALNAKNPRDRHVSLVSRSLVSVPGFSAAHS